MVSKKTTSLLNDAVIGVRQNWFENIIRIFLLVDQNGALATACLLYNASENSSLAQTELFVRHPVVRQAMEIASAEFSSLSSASQLARRVGISVTHLRALFHQHLAESPSTFLWHQKTKRAIQLLRSTGLTLKEVADQCGFADAFHLSRRVKAETGASPRSLRQREWNQVGFSSNSRKITKRAY